ncbi:ABC transporter ATP-binding protein [Microbacterium horticulturae]|uniref:ABC transporter ATP-binding protein n=1 Tax=Microbacterium horticulturae TaxID=3028316 RepID=A0ABY8C022_9MICO|nr:ABC transporter ATP-binding protein [Microbacterium sp. KACC 23027]WEG08013.1 ABC transporter ATP-binding protein [Microbacterium sp. KACC 23027]
MPEIRVSHMAKTFGDVSVLHDIDFDVKDGEFFTLLGPSGCGKSTTLNCIAGLEDPTEGAIAIGDRALVDRSKRIYVPTEERNLGMVFQSYALWPHMTIKKNLAFPLNIRHADRADRDRRIHEALDKVGLAHLENRYPHQLSGGQQQRVALARALVYSPTVLLLDEPLSNLDAKLREQARAWLKRLQSDLGITTLYVTHDQDEALTLSDRIAVMFDGVMTQIGSPKEIYERPATAAVAAFVGSCNFMLGTVEQMLTDHVQVRLQATGTIVTVATDTDWLPGSPVTVAVRPERLSIVADEPGSRDLNVLETEVVTTAYVGSRYEYILRLGDVAVQVVSPDGSLTGAVRLVFGPDDAHVFPGESGPGTEALDLMKVTA